MDSGEGVLFQASEMGRTDILQHIFAAIRMSDGEVLSQAEVGKIISVKRKDDDLSPLHVAAKNGHSDAVRSLLNAKADADCRPNQGPFKGMTPYQIATDSARDSFHVYLFEQVAIGNLSAVEQILNSGVSACLSDCSNTKDTLLHWACTFGQFQIAAVLIEFGAAVNSPNELQQTPLHTALISASNQPSTLEMVKLLMDEGGALIALDGDGDNSSMNALELVSTKVNETQLALLTQIVESSVPPAMIHTRIFEQHAAGLEHRMQEIELSTYQEIETEENHPAPALEEQSGAVEEPPTPIASNVDNNTASSVSATDVAPSIAEGIISASPDDTPAAQDTPLVVHAASEKNDDVSVSDAYTVYSSLGYNAMEGNGSDDGPGPGLSAAVEDLLFVPPLKRQTQYPHDPPLILGPGLHSPTTNSSNSSVILVAVESADVDAYALLSWSGLFEVFKGLGLAVHVKRSVCKDTKIRLKLNPYKCPGVNRYTIDTSSHMSLPHGVSITASDVTGLLYALHTFVQLIQVHSHVHQVSLSSKSNQSAVHQVHIPSMFIEDWPTVANRGIMWTYHTGGCLTDANTMKNMIHLLSKMHMNQLYLNVDAEQPTVEDNCKVAQYVYTNVFALDDACTRRGMDLIPTVTFTLSSHRLPIDLIQNFSSKSICILLLFEDTEPENVSAIDSQIQPESHKNKCIGAISEMFSSLVKMKPPKPLEVVLSCNHWTQRNLPLQLDKYEDYLNISVVKLEGICPPTLSLKPFGSFSTYMDLLSMHYHEVKEKNIISAVPLLTDNDFFYPLVLTKLGMVKSLGNFEDISLLRSSACWVIFGIPWKSAPKLVTVFLGNVLNMDCHASGLLDGLKDAQGNTFKLPPSSSPARGKPTGEPKTSSKPFSFPSFSSFFDGSAAAVSAGPVQSTASSVASGETRSARSSFCSLDNNVPAVCPLARAESVLFGLSSFNKSLSTSFTVLTKSDASVCLKYYKRILYSAKWKMGNNVSPKSLFDFVTGAAPESTAPNNNIHYNDLQNRQDLKADRNKPNMKPEFCSDISFWGDGDSGIGGAGAEQDRPRELCNSVYGSIYRSIEEYYCVVNIYSILCRTVVLAYNVNDRKGEVTSPQKSSECLSLDVILRLLLVGTRSDIANALLESLEYLTTLWMDRYLHISFRQSEKLTNVSSPVYLLKHYRMNYLHVKSAELPLVGVFNAVSKDLPIAPSVDLALSRILKRFQ